MNTPIKWVGQRGEHDCGIAAVAMAFGICYDEVDSEIGEFPRRMQSFRSVESRELKTFLIREPHDNYIEGLARIAARQNKKVRLLLNSEDCPEDQKVHAEKVYLATAASDYETGLHAVVIDGTGTVFDPYNETLRPHYSQCVISRLNYEITDIANN